MQFNEYQNFCKLKQKEGNNLIVHSLGVIGEVGEVIDCIKKSLRDQNSIDKHSLKEELGDVLWYIANLSSDVGLSLEDVAIYNVEKLKRRYNIV